MTVRPRTGPDGSVAVEPDDPDVDSRQTVARVHPTADKAGAVPETTAPQQSVPPAAGTGAVDIVSSPIPPRPAAPGEGDPVPHSKATPAESQVPHTAASIVNAAATRSAIALARLTARPRSDGRNGDAVQTQPVPVTSPPIDPADGATPGSTKPGGSRWHRVRTRLGRWRTDARYSVANWARWAMERWRRSLQLRVAVTTMLLSGLVVIIAGILSVGAISSGVLDSKRNAAHAEVINGVRVIQDQLAAAAPQDRNGLDRATQALLRTVGNRGAAAGLFSIVVVVQGAPPFVSGSTGVADVPQQLRQQVENGKFADMYSPVRSGDGTFTKGLVVGAPVPRQQSAVQLSLGEGALGLLACSGFEIFSPLGEDVSAAGVHVGAVAVEGRGQHFSRR